MRTLLLSVASLVCTLAGVIALLWALATPERFLVGIAAALALFAAGFALYRRASGRTAIDASAALRRLVPRRSWAVGAGAVLVFVGLIAGGFDPSVTPALGITTLAGVLVGFGIDEPAWGWRVILLPFAVPSAAVVGTALLMIGDTVTLDEFSAWEVAASLAAFWLVLAVTAGPGSLIGIGIHRLLLRLASTRGATAPPSPSGSRP